MRRLPAILIAGVAAVVLAGTGAAAVKEHVMTIDLPDGSTARVQYAGDVAPKIIVEPRRSADFDPSGVPAFAGFDAIMNALSREAEAMIGEARRASDQQASGAFGPRTAGFGGAPSAASSTTIVTFSDGRSSCTRTTQTITQGPGKPPRVSSTMSGDCGSAAKRSGATSMPVVNHT